MIRPDFYKPANVVKKYLTGKRKHFMPPPPIQVIGSYIRVLRYGETLYSVSKEIFGENLERYWTIIAEINPIKKPDEYAAGDVVNLPQIVSFKSNQRP